MNINKLKSLVAAAKESEHLYEQQAAAMEFTTVFGDEIVWVLEELAVTMQDDSAYFTNLFNLSNAWEQLIKGDV